jgi:hypothetical protein
MKISLDELMNKLEVGYVLGPYDAAPWSFYDTDQGCTCNAEVRMGSDGDEIEAEIQMMYDTPPEGKSPMEQICYIKCKKHSDESWAVTELLINGAPLEEDIYNWEEKSCNFFAAVVQHVKSETLPDIEDLIDEHFHSRERLNDQYGGGGSKSPKVKPADVGMKKGGGF